MQHKNGFKKYMFKQKSLKKVNASGELLRNKQTKVCIAKVS